MFGASHSEISDSSSLDFLLIKENFTESIFITVLLVILQIMENSRSNSDFLE